MKNTILSITLALFLSNCGSTGSNSSADGSVNSASEGTGKGGSMARFVISGDYLYTLNKRVLTVTNISNPIDPKIYTKIAVPFDVETLFSYNNYLYIGAESGVYIYTKPTPSQNLEKIGEFTHVKSCDPVVVEDDLAFVTLNSGSSCRINGGNNVLQILDVKNPIDPKIILERDLIEPKGLGIDNGSLFVCDGKGGLKVFTVEKIENNETNQTDVNLTWDSQSTISDIDCYDVIPRNNNLIVSNGDDVRQFDYSQFPMVELGRIK